MQDLKGKTTDIPEYLDFGFYDHVSYMENSGIRMPDIRRWLVVSQRISRLMSYWILTQKRTGISRTTFKRLASICKEADEFKASVSDFDTEISRCFKEEKYLTYDGSKPIPKAWSDYLEYDPDFQK